MVLVDMRVINTPTDTATTTNSLYRTPYTFRNMKLRKVSFADKEAYYREKLGGPENVMHSEGVGKTRPLTDEEWTLYVEQLPHPDVHGDSQLDFSYQGVRKQFYPRTDPQLGAIWKALKAIKESGVDIGTSATNMLAQIEAIKTKYPKPENVENYEGGGWEFDNVNGTENPGES